MIKVPWMAGMTSKSQRSRSRRALETSGPLGVRNWIAESSNHTIQFLQSKGSFKLFDRGAKCCEAISLESMSNVV